jgi:hypothetical protein
MHPPFEVPGDGSENPSTNVLFAAAKPVHGSDINKKRCYRNSQCDKNKSAQGNDYIVTTCCFSERPARLLFQAASPAPEEDC